MDRIHERIKIYDAEVQRLQKRLARYESRNRAFYWIIGRIVGLVVALLGLWPVAQRSFNTPSDRPAVFGAALFLCLALLTITVVWFTVLDVTARMKNPSDGTKESST